MSAFSAYPSTHLFAFPYHDNDSMYFFLEKSLKPHEKVIVCSSENEPTEDRAELAAAVRAWGAEPLIWGSDLRWKTLLRMAFESRAQTIIGSAKSILSLAKIAKVNHIPLNIYNAVVIGRDACDWMLDGIASFLDCRVFRCASPSESVIEWHPGKLRNPEAAGDSGTRNEHSIRDYLMRWGSILDCNVYHGVSGLVMEIVCFRGEKLPNLPNCAKLVLRNWNPEKDAPMGKAIGEFISESH